MLYPTICDAKYSEDTEVKHHHSKQAFLRKL
ncbi:hypothetical protein APH_0877 [Anaplasma phagocytophilum str. HZ]|uniref:Uncharacterized protein n=1 Tax=Anaplasma phagocytophilum (strain HZ) TaxID=212042 RepID=Q2GJJ8_ANAPZ|nr:hypothetical protein APH_0877 [Anaplasma phagocytophilum str. HZ]